VIHEFGHWLFGYILGIPKNKMSIQFFYRGKKRNFLNSMIFFALLDDNNQRISPDQLDEYGEILEKYIPCEKRLFWFFAGGHAFEFIIVISIAVISLISNVTLFQHVAVQITQIALAMAVIYLLMELYRSLKSKGFIGGDFTAQWAISPIKTIMFYLIYFTGLISALFLLK
jgi:hypothetical protein